MSRRFNHQPRPCKVYSPCDGGFLYTNEVKFLNIEEDIQGLDNMTYECPTCGETHKSLVYG